MIERSIRGDSISSVRKMARQKRKPTSDRLYGQGAKREVAKGSPRRRQVKYGLNVGEVKSGPANRRDYEDRSACEDVTPEWVKHDKPTSGIRTKPATEAYREGWERIFGKGRK